MNRNNLQEDFNNPRELIELLQFLTINDNIIGDEEKAIADLVQQMNKRKIISNHPFKISEQIKHGEVYYLTYVKDETKSNHRRQITAKTKENLENKIYAEYCRCKDTHYVFSNYFSTWLIEHKATEVQPPTLQRLYDDYRKYIKDKPIDKLKITQIKRADIKKCLNDAINQYHLTRKALNNVKSIFNGIFAYAIDNEDILVNPMNDLKITNTNIQPETEKLPETEVFNEEELDCFLEYIYSHYMDNRPVVSLAILLNFQLGARVGELCTLKKSDIDVLNRKIRINRIERSYRPITMVKGQLVEEKTIHVVVEGRTKKDSNRYLDLSDEALLIINRALELQKELGINSEYIFADETGKNIIRQRINDCLRDYCKRISLDPKSSHKVRKTVLSTLFANGFDLDEVKQIAGHRSKSTTLKYYLFSMKQKEDRQERLSKALSSKHCTFSQSSVNQFITA